MRKAPHISRSLRPLSGWENILSKRRAMDCAPLLTLEGFSSRLSRLLMRITSRVGLQLIGNSACGQATLVVHQGHVSECGLSEVTILMLGVE